MAVSVSVPRAVSPSPIWNEIGAVVTFKAVVWVGIAVIVGESPTASTASVNDVLPVSDPSLTVSVIVSGEPTGVD